MKNVIWTGLGTALVVWMIAFNSGIHVAHNRCVEAISGIQSGEIVDPFAK